MNIGNRLKDLRTEIGLSQSQLAKKLGVSAGNVGDWERERSKPGADALIILSKFYNKSIDWILQGEEFNSNLRVDAEKVNSLTTVNVGISEHKLLNAYRKLSDEDKLKIEGMIELKLLESQSKKGCFSNSTSGEEAATTSLHQGLA